MARLYTNENFPLPVVQELRRLGHDVLTTADAGRSGQSIPDREVLAFATEEARALVTLNRRDFFRLHLADPLHPGLVLCTYDRDFVGQARRIHTALETEGPLAGKVVRINRPVS
jgi:hypothetical protein